MKGLSHFEAFEGAGKNILTPPVSQTWYELLCDKFKDPIINILIVADIISFAVNIYNKESMLEPLAILAAILITTIVAWWQDWNSKKKFDSLNKVNDDELIKCYRDEEITLVKKKDICVGDIVILNAGDEVCADGRIVKCCDLSVNEAILTGESKYAYKSVKRTNSGMFPNNKVSRGTIVMTGYGEFLVEKVGDDTLIGKIARKATEITEENTPLTKQLKKLASSISKYSFLIGIALFIILNANYLLSGDISWSGLLANELKFLMLSIVIVIAAVPEGLSLAVVLSLAYSVKSMIKDNNLVKKMKATETIGAVNIIFTDKTGTITANKMTVVDFHAVNLDMIKANGSVNSTAETTDKIIGNPTEGAILEWIGNYRTYRNSYKIASVKPFTSEDKYMSTVTKDGITFHKGAPEVIAKICANNSFLKTVERHQLSGRRVISFAHEANGITLYDGSVFIEDPIRPDVPDAIRKCKKAGISVIMLTGDNIVTASEIAHQAGISTTSDYCIEANQWNEGMIFEDDFPKVIARCTPEDKIKILEDFQNAGYVCGFIGDGVNDSPAINKADVGISVGSGTSIAKDAADIILLDNNFSSIVKGIEWGRSIFKNIQSFLAFQITINIALCLITLGGPLFGLTETFSVIQILYINLIMDALGALALASEPATESVMNDRPRDINNSIIDKYVKVLIGISLLSILLTTSTCYILHWSIFTAFVSQCLCLLFFMRGALREVGSFSKNKTFIVVASLIFILNILISLFV